MKLSGKIGISLRWAARVFGIIIATLFVLGFIVAFAVGEGPVPSELTAQEIMMFFGLAMAIGGLIVAWRRMLTGCLLTAAGYIVFSIWNQKLALGFFSAFPIAVALYIIALFFERFSARQRDAI
jgi:hypothetical protein